MRKPPAIIHIGGGYFQVASIRWAQEAGLYTVVTDRNPSAPGAAYADHFVPIAGDDTEALLHLAADICKHYSLVDIWCHADFCLMPRARIIETLGLPGIPSGAVADALNKDRAKLIWQERGIATPLSQITASENEAQSAVHDIGLPVIMKPIGASGSMGISRVEQDAEIITAYRKARSFGGSVLIEAFLAGREFGVNGIFCEDKFHACGISERQTKSCLITEIVVPAPLPQHLEHAIYGLLEDASRSLGITQGCVKGDCILVGERPLIIEMAPRLHGNPTMSHTLPLATGMNPIRAWFGILSGEEDPLRHLAVGQWRYAGYRPLFCEGGVVQTIEGLDQAKAIPGITSIELLIQPGHMVSCHGDNRDIIGYIFAVADDPGALREIFDNAQAQMRTLI
jgi:biotin carboxylase